MKKFKDLSLNMKLFIALIIISIIGIILRWEVVKKDVSRSFRFFKKTEQTDSIKTTQPNTNQPDTTKL